MWERSILTGGNHLHHLIVMTNFASWLNIMRHPHNVAVPWFFTNVRKANLVNQDQSSKGVFASWLWFRAMRQHLADKFKAQCDDKCFTIFTNIEEISPDNNFIWFKNRIKKVFKLAPFYRAPVWCKLSLWRLICILLYDNHPHMYPHYLYVLINR